MRSALLTILALSLSTPALAESRSQRKLEAMADKLNDPVTQSAIAGAFGGLMAALLDIRIDGLAKALEPLNKGKPVHLKGNTLREMAERKDPDFEEKLQAGARTAAGSMGALASAAVVMLPQLEEAARKMEEALPKSIN